MISLGSSWDLPPQGPAQCLASLGASVVAGNGTQRLLTCYSAEREGGLQGSFLPLRQPAALTSVPGLARPTVLLCPLGPAGCAPLALPARIHAR